jgi:hypothetical protein
MQTLPGQVRHAVVAAVVLMAVCAAMLPASAAAGGRMILTGHDADFRCGVLGAECHFISTAVTYVRNGAPDPSRPVLVLDNNDLQLRNALLNAFGSAFAGQMQVVNPQSAQFASLPLTTQSFSAIVVASDQTCGLDASGTTFHGAPGDPRSYCDLNRPRVFADTGDRRNPSCFQFPSPPAAADRSVWPQPVEECPDDILSDGAQHPDPHFLADSKAIKSRESAIKSFYDAGGGLFLGSGADNGDGHSADTYYAFVDLPGGSTGSACNGDIGEDCLGSQSGDFALTAEGTAIGFQPLDVNCGTGLACATHNSFKLPRVGSSLLVAETEPGGHANTVFQDLQAPDTIITSGPGPALPVKGTPLPIAALSGGDATFGFRASEDTTTFTCTLDGSAPAPCTSPVSFTGLRRGVHTFAVAATDAAHNVDVAPAQASWLIAADADGDGFLDTNPFGGTADCNDHNAAVNPAASEVPGNRLDENCDGDIAALERVGATFPFNWFPGPCRACVHFTKLQALSVPAGATIRVRCSGRSCRFSHRLKPRKKDRNRVNLVRFVRKLGLRAGTTIELRATVPGEIGSVKRLKVVRAHRQLTVEDANLCLRPGSKHPRADCPRIE